MNDSEISALVLSAREARKRALAPFSGFGVGAAVQSEDGLIFTGCNIESASYGLTVCAERVAIWKALSEGGRNFRCLAVVADTESLAPPCGACLQVIREHCPQAIIVIANLRGDAERLRIKDLLPRAFDARFLKIVTHSKE